MSLGAILGQVMQQGAGGGSRLNDMLGNLGASMGGASGTAGGGGFGNILGQLQGALGGATGSAGGAQGGLGGMADAARDFFGKEQAGGLSTGQIGGIGAIAGALLGGGAGGAAKGGAMAILGTLAISALRAAQAGGAGQANAATMEAAPESHEIAAVTGPEAEKLMLLAMISAAKADGKIDEQEMGKIIGKAGADGVTQEEQDYVMSQLNTPIDIPALAAQATSPTQAAAVYAASLMAITADTPAEKAYLAELATALKLDPAAVSALEKTAGL